MYIVKDTQAGSSEESCICLRLTVAIKMLAWYNTATVYKITLRSVVGSRMEVVASKKQEAFY
jgi:hypothetical protein